MKTIHYRISYLVLFTLVASASCKKELHNKEIIDAALLKRNLAYNNGPKIVTITLNEFTDKVNYTALGNLKDAFKVDNTPKAIYESQYSGKL